MLFTRTIRRKLLLVLALVLSMLVTLSISGISGLHSYRDVIRELDYGINEAPHQAELISAVSLLVQPVDEILRGSRRQQTQFPQLLAETRRQILVFRIKLDKMPPSEIPAGQRPVTDALLREIDSGLTRLEHAHALLADHDQRGRKAREMLEDVTHVLALAQKVPDPVEGLARTLDEARDVYRWMQRIVWGTMAIVLILFLGLVLFGYVWVFDPIRKLHQGALRVAQGDFKHRVQLTTQDEMAELAEAFNKMTSRFQDIASDLDRQVQERSQQLVRSERLAGVGFLAAGVAHEINNPLSAIAMASESLEGRLAGLLGTLDKSEADIVRQYLQMSQNEAFRCKQITERLLDFSRGHDSTREQTDVARLISEVIAMVQYLSKFREKKIEFLRTSPCYAEINGPEIKQVLLNLVANGLDAMDRGGTLKIDLLEQTDHVVITVQDEGCGMTPEVLEHMFEPFFTQKQNGQGTGLGLSISHRIISQHGGTITAKSDGPGSGSTFCVRLPRRAMQAAAA